MNDFPITEADLQAYVDDLLPPSRRNEIEAYLLAMPEELHRLKSYRAQNDALRTLFDPILEEPLPPGLQRWPTKVVHQRLWQWQHLAAGLLVAILSTGAGWLLHTPNTSNTQLAQNVAPFSSAAARSQTNTLAHEAAVAHVIYVPDIVRPVEIAADQEDQMVNWLSQRIGNHVRPPKLGKLGYELIGGRLLPGKGGPIAQFMYHNETGQRLTVYISSDQTQNKETGFRFAQDGPVNVFYWIDGKFGYALSAGIDKNELAHIATAVYTQLRKS